MRILMLSKALVVGAYQKKVEALAALPGVELTVAVPPSWQEPGVGAQVLERRFTEGYQLEVLPIALNGKHHFHFFPTLDGLVKRVRPDVFHIDEEAFNLATFLAMRSGVRYGAKCCFYNWATIDRTYPPPFSFFERYAFKHAAHAIAGVQDAADIIRKHGYTGPMSILPQFGVDPELFAPAPREPRQQFVLGYLGRLVPQKGLLDVIEALPLLPEHVVLRLVGDGVQKQELLDRAAALGVAARVQHVAWTNDVPAEIHQFDVTVLPSHTTANWKEQFGRVIIESMSCGVPMIGSSSGEIPRVIGDGGLVYPEKDVRALADCVLQLLNNPGLRERLGQQGRQRVLDNYTQSALAQQYFDIYRKMLEG
jgi:glycosyltransferase involved in cell wall biosynthesis